MWTSLTFFYANTKCQIALLSYLRFNNILNSDDDELFEYCDTQAVRKGFANIFKGVLRVKSEQLYLNKHIFKLKGFI